MGTCFSCIEDLQRFVLGCLDGIPHDTYRSKTSSSIYITFADPRIGELTIRDHRPKTAQIRWNIVYGYYGKKRKVNTSGHERYFYSEHTVLQFVSDFEHWLDSLHCVGDTKRRSVPWA